MAGAPQINLAVAAIAAAFVNIALSTVAPSHPHRGVQDFEPRQIVDEHTIRSVGGFFFFFFFVISYSHEAYLDYGGVHF